MSASQFSAQQGYGNPYESGSYGRNPYAPQQHRGSQQPPSAKPSGKNSPLIYVIMLLAGIILGGLVMFLIGLFQGNVQKPIPATLTESKLDTVVGSYTYDGVAYDITARQAIEDSTSVEARLNDDGSYDSPTADMVLSYARNRILALLVEENGITVSDEEISQYALQMSGTDDIAQIAQYYGMDEEQARRIIGEACATEKLRTQVIGSLGTAPTAPSAPADGNTETANTEYGQYIISLLGTNWDASTGTWANTDNAYYDALQGMVFSADSANYEAAQAAYYVAYSEYQANVTNVEAQWNDYVNGFLSNGAITIDTLLY